MNKKLILCDTSYLINLNNENPLVKEHFKQYSEHQFIVHEESLKELTGKKVHTHPERVDGYIKELKNKGIWIFGFFPDDLWKPFNRESLIERCTSDNPTEEEKIQGREWMKNNSGINPNVSREEAYQNVHLRSEENKKLRWEHIKNNDGKLGNKIQLEELINVVEATFFPKLEKDPITNAIKTFSYNNSFDGHSPVQCSNVKVDGDFLKCTDQDGRESFIISPNSKKYWNNLEKLKEDYHFAYAARLRSALEERLYHINLKTKDNGFQVYFDDRQAKGVKKVTDKKNNAATIEANMFPDLKIGLYLLPFVDHFFTCDEGQPILLKFLLPEHAKKVKYVPQHKTE